MSLIMAYLDSPLCVEMIVEYTKLGQFVITNILKTMNYIGIKYINVE